MQFKYCPQCGKAGLHFRNPTGQSAEERMAEQGFPEPPAWREDNREEWIRFWQENPPEKRQVPRWCPRCAIWVIPIKKVVATHARPGKAPRVRLR